MSTTNQPQVPSQRAGTSNPEKMSRNLSSKPESTAALEAYRSGLSLREIGQQLSCSHQHVKRLFTGKSLPTFDWDGDILTPHGVKQRLQKMLRVNCGRTWDKVPKRYEHDWVDRCLSALFRSSGDDEKTIRNKFSELIDAGPSRPGRRRFHEDNATQMSEKERQKMEVPISSILRRYPDGTLMAYGDIFDTVWREQQKVISGHSRSRAQELPQISPTGKPFEPCPICQRLTAYTMPPCTIQRNGQTLIETPIGFKSSLCKKGRCGQNREELEPESKPQAFVQGFEERRFRRVSSPDRKREQLP